MKNKLQLFLAIFQSRIGLYYWLLLGSILGVGLGKISIAQATAETQFSNEERFYGVSFRGKYGRIHNLKGYDNKVIILYLFYHDDFASLAELGQLSLFKRKSSKDVVIIPIEMTVDTRQEARALRKTLRGAGIRNLDVYVDDNGKTAYYLNVRSLPTTVVFDAYGKVVMQIEGFYDWQSNTIRQFYWKGSPKRKS